MYLVFACAGSAAHSNIFESSSETTQIVTREVRNENQSISVIDGTGHFYFFKMVLAYLYFHKTTAPQAIGDYYGCLAIFQTKTMRSGNSFMP